MKTSGKREFEWPTLLALGICYGSWLTLALAGGTIMPAVWIVLVAIFTTFYWSLVHEIIHGHPTANQRLNELLVSLPLGWIYPVGRFRDTHLDHHSTGELTDPFDDPESWYMTGTDWRQTSGISRSILQFNNTLFGRMLIGPIIVVSRFVRSEFLTIWRGTEAASSVRNAWAFHFLMCAVLTAILWRYSNVAVWQFAAAAYLGISILLIRTFLEHQASEDKEERTVIIEASCPLAFLFLFNNLHCVHHMHPGIAWYRLPGFYRQNRQQFIEHNRNYVYPSYANVIAKYFFQAKEPIAHPFLRQDGVQS